MKKRIGATAALLLVALLILRAKKSGSEGEPAKKIVLTALFPIYSLVQDLAAGTNIEVKYLFPEGRRMEDQGRWFKENGDAFKETAEKAEAVITLGSVWRNDPLYAYARRHKLDIVNIDAAEPVDPLFSGIAKLEIPTGSDEEDRYDKIRIGSDAGISPYAWLSLSNGAKMAEIISLDLKRLSPGDEKSIEKNLADLKTEMFNLKSKYETALMEAAAFSVVALTPDLVYLTDNFNIDVADYLLKDDYRWNEDDLGHLKNTLRDKQVSVVINDSTVDEKIVEAIKEAGASLAILDTMDFKQDRKAPGRLYVRTMENNLKILRDAFGSF